MEYDRFGRNHKLYILGMITLVLCLGLFFFSLYLLPYLIWQLNYNVPDIIILLITNFQVNYNYSSGASKTLVWLIFFVPCLITGFISYWVSNYIDKKIYDVEDKLDKDQENHSSQDIQKEIKESASLGFKIIGLMIVIVVLMSLLQYLVQLTV